jgi:type I protein arginine methyltransferase
MMYTLNQYGQMLADRRRTKAYVAALQRAVRPGSVVVEIGTGVGFFALVAARLGASRVYAFEPSPQIVLADRLIAANGGGPVQLIRALSTHVELTERADVVFSDLRGNLPIFGDHFAAIADARARILKADGVLIPRRDTVWGALVESETIYGQTVGMWDAIAADVDIQPLREAQIHTPTQARLSSAELLSAGQLWQTLDYATIDVAPLAGALRLVAERDGVCHGIGLWFDSELWDDVTFSNHPAEPQMIYGQLFFPLPRPETLAAGDVVECAFAAEPRSGVWVWRWTTAMPSATYVQSTEGLPDISEALKRGGSDATPRVFSRSQVSQ